MELGRILVVTFLSCGSPLDDILDKQLQLLIMNKSSADRAVPQTRQFKQRIQKFPCHIDVEETTRNAKLQLIWLDMCS